MLAPKLEFKRGFSVMSQLANTAQKSKQAFIRTRYCYPNGEILELALIRNNTRLLLTDQGKTLGWLDTQINLTSEQLQLIVAFCESNDIELEDKALKLQVDNPSALSLHVDKLAQVIVKITGTGFIRN